MTVPARRGAHGHFMPGISGNPGGRTSALSEVRELLKPHVALYVQRLNELVRHPDPTVALSALREALDRLLGKPVQSVESDVRTVDFTKMIQEAYLQVVSGKAGGYGAPTIAELRDATPATTLEAGEEAQAGRSDTITEW
jgi:hypothetical protein